MRAFLAAPVCSLTLPTVLYVVEWGLEAAWRGAWLVGCVLNGPWAETAARASNSWAHALLAWSVFLVLTPLVRRTRIGDLHWSVHLSIVLAWMLIGLRQFGKLG